MLWLIYLQTSLLMTILGEMKVSSGDVNVSGSFSYVPQEAWVYSASFRDNILLGGKMDQKKYRHAIKASALQKVIQSFSHSFMKKTFRSTACFTSPNVMY